MFDVTFNHLLSHLLSSLEVNISHLTTPQLKDALCCKKWQPWMTKITKTSGDMIQGIGACKVTVETSTVLQA